MWLQLRQIVTDFNNFCIAETENNVQNRRAFSYLLLKESVYNDVINVSLFARPVSCEPRHWQVEASSVAACVDAEGGHFEHYLWLLLSK